MEEHVLISAVSVCVCRCVCVCVCVCRCVYRCVCACLLITSYGCFVMLSSECWKEECSSNTVPLYLHCDVLLLC